jgi:hypothetical protein
MKITWKCFTVYDAVNDEVLIIHNAKERYTMYAQAA